MVDRRDERVPTVMDRILNIDLSKLDGDFAKSGNPSKNMLEIAQNQLVYAQTQGMMEDMQTARIRQRREEAKAEMMDALQTAALRQQVQAPVQPAASNMQDTLKTILTPEFLTIYATLDPETKKMLMQMGMMQGLAGGKDGGSTLPMLMMMQQQKPVEKPSNDISAKDMVGALTEGIKLGQGNQSQNNSPTEMFKAIKEIVVPFQQSQQDVQNQLLTAKIDQLKEMSQPMTIEKNIALIKELNETLGSHQGASEADVQIAALTAETRLKEYQLNLDARRIAEEAKTENMKWQQIGGLLMSVGGAVAPSIMGGLTGGAQGLGPQAAQPHQPQGQPVNRMQEAHLSLKCPTCSGTFDLPQNPDGSYSPKVRCPHCKEVLEIDPPD